MPVIGTLARDVFFLAGFPWDHHDASVFDAALGDDVIGEMLYLGTGAAQRGHLHAVIIVEMNMKRGERQIVMAMIIFDQPPRHAARSMIVNVDQRRDAFSRLALLLRSLLHAGAREIADRFGTVLISVLGNHGVELPHQFVIKRNCDALHGSFLGLETRAAKKYDDLLTSSYPVCQFLSRVGCNIACLPGVAAGLGHHARCRFGLVRW